MRFRVVFLSRVLPFITIPQTGVLRIFLESSTLQMREVMFRLIAIGMLLFGMHTAFCQEFHYSLRNYKAVDGLPQSQVNIMLEDQNGYLWIGTHGGGLARFDGREFKVYTTLDGLLSNIVTFLKTLSDGYVAP